MEPISYTTPTPYVIIGGLRIVEHWVIRLLNEATIVLNVDPIHINRNRLIISELGIAPNLEYSSKAEAYVNPCILPYTSNINAVIKHIENNESIKCGDTWLTKVEGGHVAEDCSISTLKGPWDLIKHNEPLLMESMVKLLGLINAKGNLTLIESSVSSDVKVNTSEGPVLIIRSSIDAPAYIKGPALIGPNTAVAPFTYIRPGTVAYMGNRLSGEIKNSILDCCTFKEHYGYLGDSYVGKWVNFGAGTTVSNLKNTLGTIRFMGIDTGMVKLGPVIGDWVKTGINASIMTGKSIGPGSHVYGVVKVDVPPFTIYNGLRDGELTAMDRERVREIVLRSTGSVEEADYAITVFDSTQGLRDGIKRGKYAL